MPARRAALLLLACLAAIPGRAAGPPGVRRDRYGDPLPPGAVARLGTVRFRPGPVSFTVAFAPGGKVLATMSRAGVGLVLWDPSTGRPLRRVRGSWFGRSLAFSPRGQTLLLGGSLTLLDVATGKELRKFKPRVVGYFEFVAFSPDGRTVAAGEFRARASRVVLWDAATGRELRELKGHTAEVTGLAFAPDGKTLASASLDKTVRLWDVKTGKEIRRLEPDKDEVWSVAFAPGGKVLASGSKGGPIRLWDVKSGKGLRRLRGHEGAASTLAFAPGGKLLASGGQDGMVRLWEPATGKQVRRWQAAAFSVTALAFAPDGKVLASASPWDHAIRRWEVATGKEVGPVDAHTGLVTSVRFAPDGKSLLSYGRDRKFLVWDLATQTPRRRLFGGRPAPPGRGIWSAAALSPDEKVLALAEWDNVRSKPDLTVRLWDTTTGKQLHALPGHSDRVASLAFSPDGKVLASSDKDGAHLWDIATGKELRRLKGRQGLVWSVEFSPDGKTLACGEAGGAVVLWEVGTGKEVRRWRGSGDIVYHLRFSPDGTRLASSDRSTAVSVWDPSTGKELWKFAGCASQLLSFSPSGRILACETVESRNLPGGETNHSAAIRLWDLLTGQEVRRIEVDQGFVWSLDFSPDGRTLASGGGDSTVLLWDLAGGRRRARLTDAELGRLWTDLGGSSARAYEALWALASAPREAVGLVRRRLRPVAAADPRRVARLVAELGGADFAAREKATKELEALGERAGPALRKAASGRLSPEARRRLGRLLRRLEATAATPGRLRPLRALEVLEYAGTPEAREVLEGLAKGAPEARLTRAARAALQRLERRSAGKP